MGKKLWLFLACMFMTVGMAFAQKQITGTVVDAENGEPLIGVTVRVPNTNTGAVTDANGKFNVTLPAGQKNLNFSFVGMKPATLAARNGMVVRLETNTKAMDEVMVIAFGTAKKSSYTGSAKVVGSEDLEKSQVTSVTDALAGVVPGLQLTSSNGAPGSTSSIHVRGFSSVNAGQEPLIILDGAPYSGDISNINPADVESITVQKDAASNALYGSRGANGVIMITTKKAKVGQDAVITVDAKWGANSRALRQYDVIQDPAQFYEMHYGALRDNYMVNKGMSANEAWQLANTNMFGQSGDGGVGYNVYTVPNGQMLIGQNGKLNPNATLGRMINNNGTDYWLYPDNWLDESTVTGFRQEYNVTASGANEKGNFLASMGYLDNNGITINSNLKRFSGRLKADYLVKEWAKVGMNVSYTRFDGNTLGNNGSDTSTGNIWNPALTIAPIYPFYVRDGKGLFAYDANGLQIFDYGNAEVIGIARPTSACGDAHPYNDVLLNVRNYEGNASTGNAFLDLYLAKGLTFTANGTYTLDETRGTYMYNKYYGQFDTTGGTVEKYHQRIFNFNTQQLLNYNFSIRDKNNFNVLLGHEYSKDRTYLLSATKHKMFSQDNLELDGAVIDDQAASSSKSTYNVEGYFGRVMYDYAERIFLNASFRRDASSIFSPDHRWGNFWSASAAWRIAKESWFPKTKWLNDLKVKASVGSQGNDGISAYRYVDRYTITNSGGNVGTSFAGKGTPDITWETNTNINAGIEAELFKNRLSIGVEWYDRITTDMLFAVSVPPSTGYGSYWDNVGDMKNTGWEIDLNARLINTKKVKWDFNANVAFLKNKVTSLDPKVKNTSFYTLDGKEYKGYVYGSGHVLCEDAPIYSWRQKEFAGIYTEDTYKSTYDSQTDPSAMTYDPKKAGLSMFYVRTKMSKPKVDANGNPVLDANGVQETETWYENVATTDWNKASYYMNEKSTVPPVYGGFGTSIQVCGFDLSANFSYQIGGWAYDGSYASFMSSPTSTSVGNNYHADLLKSWSSNNQGSDIPRFMFDDLYSAASSTRFLTKASYLNIENISFGYTLPKDVLAKIHLTNLRIFAQAENVFYWSKRRGFDPRQTYVGATNVTNYSPMRTISGGVKITF